MAIIIEEEKKGTGILVILAWLVIIAIIVVAAYYIFFISPASVIIVPSGNLQNIAPISQVNLNAQSVESVLQSSLQQYVATTSSIAVPVGRANPFISP